MNRTRCCAMLLAGAVGLLLASAPGPAWAKPKKKLSLAELAALEWKLEQGAKAVTTGADPETRKKAVTELASLEDPRAARPLALALKEDPDPGVRAEAARALAAMQSPEAMGLLQLVATADPDEEVRKTAADLLKKFPRRMKPAALPLKPRPFKEPKGKVTDKLVEKTLASPSGDARLWAVQQLATVKVKARDELLKKHLTADPSGRVRVEAARILAQIKKKQALPDLMRAAEDGDPAVRFEVARILSEFNDAGALAALQKLAESDANETVRAESKDLLEPDTPAGKRLLKTRITKLKSANPADRITALDALEGYTHWRAMVPMSCAMVADKSELVRQKAVQVLPTMHDVSVLTALRVAAVAEPDPKIKKGVRKAIVGLARQVDGLIKQLKGGSVLQRAKAARALGQGGYPQAVEPLIEALKDDSPKVRLLAANGLMSYPDSKEALEALKVAGADKNKKIRKAVDSYFKRQVKLAKWRQFYKDPHRVVTWTVDKDPVKRADAAIALGVAAAQTAQHGLSQLLLADPVEEVRLFSAWALVLMGTEKAEAALRKAAEKDKSEKVRLTARKYLVIHKVSRDDLVTQLTDEDPSVRRDAAEALSLMANSEVLAPLVSATMCDDNPYVRSAALRGLARIGSPLAKTVISVTMKRDPDKRVRRTAMVMHILAGG